MWYGSNQTRRPMGGRFLLALILAVVALVSYYGQSEDNRFTGRTQRVAMTTGEEIALGLQAAPRMAQDYGGLDRNPRDQATVKAVGQQLLTAASLQDHGYRFDFHLLGDRDTINAFALPGGQIFITRALYDRLGDADELAAVLGHEIGHVVGRHGAAQLAKQQLTHGLASAAGVAAGDVSGQQLAMLVGRMVTMRYGRGDELESDRLGVQFLAESGFAPEAMLRVMRILASASQGSGPPEFFSTHPNPENRLAAIREAIAALPVSRG